MSVSSHFEYKLRQVDYVDDPKSLRHAEIILDGSGHDGWDLVTAVPIVEEGKTVRIVFCLKKHSRRSIV